LTFVVVAAIIIIIFLGCVVWGVLWHRRTLRINRENEPQVRTLALLNELPYRPSLAHRPTWDSRPPSYCDQRAPSYNHLPDV